MKRYIGLLVLVVGLAALPNGSHAAQQDPAPKLVITDVDTSEYPQVKVYLAAPDGRLPDPATITLHEDGEPVDQPTFERQDVGVAVAVAISLRRSMRGQGLPGSPSRLADARALTAEFTKVLSSTVDLITIAGFHREVVPVIATQVLTDGGGLHNRLYYSPPAPLADFAPLPFSASDPHAYSALSPAILSATHALSPTLLAQSGALPSDVASRLRRQLKAIIVIADSCDDLDINETTPATQSCVVPEDVQRALAAQADTLTLFAVGVGSDAPQQVKPVPPDDGYSYVANHALLRAYAGERFFHLYTPDPQQVQAKRDEALRALHDWAVTRRHQLVITYSSRANGSDHTITVDGGQLPLSQRFSERPITPTIELTSVVELAAFNIETNEKYPPIDRVAYYQDGILLESIEDPPFALQWEQIPRQPVTSTITVSVTLADGRILTAPESWQMPPRSDEPLTSPTPESESSPSEQPSPAPSRLTLWIALALTLAALAGIGALWWARRRRAAVQLSTDQLVIEIPAPKFALATIPDRDEIHPLRPDVTIIGSREYVTDITLTQPGIAEKHLEIRVQRDDSLEVINRAGSNDTYINNRPVEPNKSEKLAPGDLLTLGNMTLKCIRWNASELTPSKTADAQPAPNREVAGEVGV